MASRWKAAIQFRVDEAPHHLLIDGVQFELYEGPKKVATGSVTDGGHPSCGDNAMSNPMTLGDFAETIRSQFHESPPNGWDEARCFELVSAAASPHQTTNCTSFDYGFCNWFEVHINSDGDECYWTLTIKLSFVAPTYCVHWTQYESPAQGAVIPTAPDGYQVVEEKVRVAVENAGFFELPEQWCEQKIQDVELELSGTDNVTLSKCLFSDYAG